MLPGIILLPDACSLFGDQKKKKQQRKKPKKTKAYTNSDLS